MVFSDWPLSLGSINPPGWLRFTAPFLEHSHRLLATVVGLLVVTLFSWSYLQGGQPHRWKRAGEVILLVAILAVIFGIFIEAGREKVDAVRKWSLIKAGLGISLFPLGWLAWSWVGKRGWSPLQKLSALALLLVTTQAILGGLRVTEISNTFATIHGCLAQGFFCVLILIALMADKNWAGSGYFAEPREKSRCWLTRASAILLFLVVIQLIFGASMRHFHRSGLADSGILLTQGRWIPDFGEPIITAMFLHKLTAMILYLFAVLLLIWLLGSPSPPRARRHLVWIVSLLTAQIIMGIGVIGTEKNFWVTNFHVLNGLTILALSFVFLIRSIKLSR